MSKKIIIFIAILSIGISLVAFNYNNNEHENLSVDSTPNKAASLSSKLDDVEKRLAEIRLRKQQLQNSINEESAKQSKYGAEVALLTNDINIKLTEIEEIELDIERLNLQIELLEYNIGETTENIVETEEEIVQLEDEINTILTSMYMSVKTYNEINTIFDNESSYDFIKQDLYQQAIQEDTASDIAGLNDKREELEEKKIQLDTDRKQVEEDKVLLDEQKVALDKERSLLNEKRSILNSKIQASLNSQQQKEYAIDQSTEEERKLLGEREYLRQQILKEFGSVPSGSFVKAGTVIGVEGNTGWSTGPHLHFGTSRNGVVSNPCNFLNCSNKSDGSLKWPISPKGVITSGYGQRAYDFHAAIDISTGGGAAILAAHDGWLTRGKQYCYDLSWVKCNGGYANYAIICQNRDNCNSGWKTIYWHLAN